MDVVKMQMLVHDKNMVQARIYMADSFIEVPDVWNRATVEEVDTHQYQTLSANHRHIKFTAVNPPSDGASNAQT
ncbi:hypothetical protein AC579_7198 [Pseudocercospora musae]|uniref:Uncharacterized protein n=1 Tax=Pseudocercospora musae TaxID=113226 RepID=A0A139I484_9PEZI|nr:hypothetical protein AC579_7198 [Pseudocercospora musae]